eukprot:1771660-Prymnesium_polylepis.1
MQRGNEQLAQQLTAKDAEQEQERQRLEQEVELHLRQFNATIAEYDAQRIPPADLDAMRRQLIADTEAPWKVRVNALESELEQAKGGLSAQRREIDALKDKLGNLSHEHHATVRDLETRHEMVEAELRAKLDLRGGGGGGGGEGEPVDVERARR